MDPPDPGVAELTFKNGNRAVRVFARPGEAPKHVAERLGLDAESRPVLVVCGSAKRLADGASPEAGAVLRRAISQAAGASRATVLDGGTESGVMSIVGEARSADPLALPVLIGVAPRGRVREPDDPESERTPLEPHHSHFVLAHGDRWGDETELLFSIAAVLAPTDEVVVVLAGGGEAVQTGIAASRAVLVTLGDEWAASPACRYELAIAVERRMPLIGVALGRDPRPSRALALLPPDVEIVDAGGSVSRAIDLVGARLAV